MYICIFFIHIFFLFSAGIYSLLSNNTDGLANSSILNFEVFTQEVCKNVSVPCPTTTPTEKEAFTKIYTSDGYDSQRSTDTFYEPTTPTFPTYEYITFENDSEDYVSDETSSITSGLPDMDSALNLSTTLLNDFEKDSSTLSPFNATDNNVEISSNITLKSILSSESGYYDSYEDPANDSESQPLNFDYYDNAADESNLVRKKRSNHDYNFPVSGSFPGFGYSYSDINPYAIRITPSPSTTLKPTENSSSAMLTGPPGFAGLPQEDNSTAESTNTAAEDFVTERSELIRNSSDSSFTTVNHNFITDGLVDFSNYTSSFTTEVPVTHGDSSMDQNSTLLTGCYVEQCYNGEYENIFHIC